MDRFFTSLPKSLSQNSPSSTSSSSSTSSNKDSTFSSNAPDRDRDRDGDGDGGSGRRETKGETVLSPSAEEGDVLKNLPKGVVLGKDGKPYVFWGFFSCFFLL